jgi:hypothetical protein
VVDTRAEEIGNGWNQREQAMKRLVLQERPQPRVVVAGAGGRLIICLQHLLLMYRLFPSHLLRQISGAKE